MATMYSLFFGVLFTVVCSFKGNGSGDVSSLKPRVAHTFLLDQESMQRTGTKWSSAKLNQGMVAHPKFNSCSLKIKNSPDKSGSKSLIFLTRSPFKFLTVSQPRPIYSATTGSYVHLLRLSPAKFLTIVGGCTSFVSKVLSDEFFASFFAEKKEEPCHSLVPNFGSSSGIKRDLIIQIASNELGTHEATGNNDGPRIEEYLRYTNLGKGYEWCAAFVSWCAPVKGL
ncbi:hypothetical protein SAMN05660841_03249 [Sphingobacterium nematocida]|uniref:Uncharacterized protein n=1 Tax=Sphingobacterium nematocida TaxID=1513896 RepID=A0A1T5FH64_9SPHI|nr:hypothetical protein [Sphingobacterium nematocida]SKB95511.1 hypothetical protein SAMN05660841_03249 [Sphingobacterium nematocida]